jgi:hypothetical protein
MTATEFSVQFSRVSGLVLNCPECGTVAEYPMSDGAPGTEAALSEINDDALMHALEH